MVILKDHEFMSNLNKLNEDVVFRVYPPFKTSIWEHFNKAGFEPLCERQGMEGLQLCEMNTQQIVWLFFL